MDCEAYSSFEGISSDHRIVTAIIRLSLRRNTTRTTIIVHYDWSLLNNRDIRDKYALTQRNKFNALQEKIETHTLNDVYEHFVKAHLQAVAECIPTKQRAKPRIPWETLAVRKKRADVKTTCKCNWKNPTNTNALKLKKDQNELASIYLKEQTEYIQNQIEKIRDSVEDIQSRIVCQMVNEVSRKLNWKLPTNKKEYNYGNNISRIYSETLLKLHMNKSREL